MDEYAGIWPVIGPAIFSTAGAVASGAMPGATSGATTGATSGAATWSEVFSVALRRGLIAGIFEVNVKPPVRVGSMCLPGTGSGARPMTGGAGAVAVATSSAACFPCGRIEPSAANSNRATRTLSAHSTASGVKPARLNSATVRAS
ncbi:hypothetical protein NBCG_00263 [Nocardioidaceae bacterium Broad-1]|nr:hypothetical protein NBCG_00263 [Nocardioidaceae bacterium Broad-1]